MHVLNLAPEMTELWLRWARNQAETGSRVLGFIWLQGHCPVPGLRALPEGAAAGGQRLVCCWFGQKGCSRLRFVGFLESELKGRGGNRCCFQGEVEFNTF